MYLKRIFLFIGFMINFSSCFALFVEDTISIQNIWAYESDQEFSLNANVVKGDGLLIANNILLIAISLSLLEPYGVMDFVELTQEVD